MVGRQLLITFHAKEFRLLAFIPYWLFLSMSRSTSHRISQRLTNESIQESSSKLKSKFVPNLIDLATMLSLFPISLKLLRMFEFSDQRAASVFEVRFLVNFRMFQSIRWPFHVNWYGIRLSAVNASASIMPICNNLPSFSACFARSSASSL